jgi:hypothetical protein
MYIGHFAVANAIIALNPTLPTLPILIGVSFPDLLWPGLIFAGKEKASVNPKSALQKDIDFEYYPYSHSLIVTSFITLVPAGIFAFIYSNIVVGLAFLISSISHWLVDVLMHLRDLPIVGYGKDIKLGFGLWKNGKLAFLFEYFFYAVLTIPFVPADKLFLFLGVGALLHLINANSFFGFTKSNPFPSSKAYAGLALFGFVLGITIYEMLWKM